MIGKRGWDTYYIGAGPKFGNDVILDTGGYRDETSVPFERSTAKGWDLDLNNNGKIDAYSISGRGQGTLTILDCYDDTRSKPPFCRGPGYIEIVSLGKGGCIGYECPTS
jgi:hypothetical protein